MWKYQCYLYESVAVLHKVPPGDLFEALTDVREALSLLDQFLIVSDQSEGHTEQYLWALKEEAIPYSQHCLTENTTTTFTGLSLPLSFIHF